MANVEYKPPELSGKGLEIAVYNSENRMHLAQAYFTQERIDYHFNKLMNHFPPLFSIVAYDAGSEVRREKGKRK